MPCQQPQRCDLHIYPAHMAPPELRHLIPRNLRHLSPRLTDQRRWQVRASAPVSSVREHRPCPLDVLRRFGIRLTFRRNNLGDLSAAALGYPG